jgi:hypothetical protein
VKIKRLTEDTWVARVLGWLAWAIFRYRGWFVYPQIVLFALSIIYTARYLKFGYHPRQPGRLEQKISSEFRQVQTRVPDPG